MSKVIGIIELTPKPGFPKLTGKEGDETLTMKYTCAEDELSTLPDYTDSFSDTRYPYFTSLTGHLLDVKDITRDNTGEFYHVELQFKDPQGGSGGSVPSGPIKEEWNCKTQDYDVPIEQHEDYLVNWNHRLIGSETATEAPSWWYTSKTSEISKDDAKKYAWIKPGDKVPDGWHEIFDVQQKGVESFRSGVTTVNCVKRCTDRNKLIADANKDYMRQTPKETFGKTGSWLRGGSSFDKEGRYWVMTVSYLNFKQINLVVYPH